MNGAGSILGLIGILTLTTCFGILLDRRGIQPRSRRLRWAALALVLPFPIGLIAWLATRLR
jgi:hypothetical protein